MRLPKDKLQHLAAGAIIALSSIWIGVTYSLILVATAAIGKEVYDKFDHGKPELMDSVATIAGGVLVVVMLEVVT